MGRAAGIRNKTRTSFNRRPESHFIHNADDDYSRLAYSEILSDEKKETVAGFWARANTWFASKGITVQRVLTDNGNGYRSHAFAHAVGADIKHKRTRPYRPQTNGKVERFNRTLLDEWAYARPYTSEAERVAAFRPGCITTIIIEATHHSKVNHQPAVSPTSQGNTTRLA